MDIKTPSVETIPFKAVVLANTGINSAEKEMFRQWSTKNKLNESMLSPKNDATPVAKVSLPYPVNEVVIREIFI
jgi:hypothetical protein